MTDSERKMLKLLQLIHEENKAIMRMLLRMEVHPKHYEEEKEKMMKQCDDLFDEAMGTDTIEEKEK